MLRSLKREEEEEGCTGARRSCSEGGANADAEPSMTCRVAKGRGLGFGVSGLVIWGQGALDQASGQSASERARDVAVCFAGVEDRCGWVGWAGATRRGTQNVRGASLATKSSKLSPFRPADERWCSSRPLPGWRGVRSALPGRRWVRSAGRRLEFDRKGGAEKDGS